MPTYDYECARCGTFEFFMHITEPPLKKCPLCKRCKVTKLISPLGYVKGDIADWSTENRGKGRYCPQLAKKPGDPNAYATSKWDLIDQGYRRGWSIDRDGDG